LARNVAAPPHYRALLEEYDIGLPPLATIAKPEQYRFATKEDIMRSNYRMALTLLGGIALGGGLIHGLHAQTKAPAYVVVAIRKINDADAFKAGVVDKATPESLTAAGGKYVIRTQSVTALDGTPPQRFVLIAFDSVEKAKAWNDSAGQKEINAARIKSTDSLSFIVEGLN
jgi:uncharacterized protein (DUF1330 family)